MTENKYDNKARRELAQKLDEELDQFMDVLAENRTKSDELKEPFDFEKWCEKIDQHPLFMEELKTNKDGEYSEAIQALQALKFDNEEMTPEELIEKAEIEKTQGNKHFQHKKYRWAIEAYTNGISAYAPDPKLNAVLYANRAAAHKRLGNLRSAFKDCMFALKYDQQYFKAILRGGECLYELGHAQKCVEWLEKNLSILSKDPSKTSEIIALRDRARRCATKQSLALRKKKLEEKRQLNTITILAEQIKRRGINAPALLGGEDEPCEWYEKLKVQIPQVGEIPVVYYDRERDELVWPLLLQYPEIGNVDLIIDCMESTSLSDLLHEVLNTSAECDKEQRFHAGNVELFVPIGSEGEVLRVNFIDNLRTILSLPGVEVQRGVPVILIYNRAYVKKSMRVVCGQRMKPI